MSWLIGWMPPKEPELLDHFFAVLGRALYTANAFEAKCTHILRLLRLVNLIEQGKDLNAALHLANTLKDKMLAGTISEIKTSVKIEAADIELLEMAKDARNFIAHEGGQIGYIFSADERAINEQLELLRLHVRTLAHGDNVASKWEYGMCEKEPPPYGTSELYPDALEDWIFGGATYRDFSREFWHIGDPSPADIFKAKSVAQDAPRIVPTE